MIDFSTHHDGARPRVLLVEDHVDSARSIEQLLSLFGYDVRVEVDGLAAVQRAQEFAPFAALIDLSLPTLDGCEVASLLRRSAVTRDSLLVAMTGWSDDAHADRARAAGFDLHLVKPLRVESLIGALSGVPV